MSSTIVDPQQPTPPPSVPRPGVFRAPRKVSWSDLLLKWCAGGAAVVLILMLLALLAVLVQAAVPAFQSQGLRFIYGTQWLPGGTTLLDKEGMPRYDEFGGLMTSPPVFGALPVIWGTATSSLIALLIAVPLSFGAAIFLVRIAPFKLAVPVSFLIEFLAAIPSLAYGLWGFAVLGPILQKTVETWAFKFEGVPGLGWLFTTQGRHLAPQGLDLLTAGVLLGIMIIPIITALTKDILLSVPRAQVEGTTALGATWWQSSLEMLRYSRAALFGAVMLGLARAAGETIAVTLVIGNVKQILPTPFAPAQTMASLLANEFGEAASNPEHRGALWGVALILLIMSLIFNVVARYLFVGKDARSAGAH